MNLFDLPELAELPASLLTDELVTTLVDTGSVRIERIVSTGQTSDWYDQAETEFVALLEGSAEIELADGRVVALVKGDTLVIAPHERHRVSQTSVNPPCIWLCVFY
jgi:cupin 2 domain-containing protein